MLRSLVNLTTGAVEGDLDHERFSANCSEEVANVLLLHRVYDHPLCKVCGFQSAKPGDPGGIFPINRFLAPWLQCVHRKCQRLRALRNSGWMFSDPNDPSMKKEAAARERRLRRLHIEITLRGGHGLRRLLERRKTCWEDVLCKVINGRPPFNHTLANIPSSVALMDPKWHCCEWGELSNSSSESWPTTRDKYYFKARKPWKARTLLHGLTPVLEPSTDIQYYVVGKQIFTV